MTEYTLFYWPEIPGRGEFVRLALEEIGVPYRDVAKEPGGMAAITEMSDREGLATPPFAPPFLQHGGRIIAQTPLILAYLGERHGLMPKDKADSLWVQQILLTIADAVTEAHDCHHPLGSGAYYEDQKREAAKRSGQFRAQRITKFLDWLEEIHRNNPDGQTYLVGDKLTVADLALYQLVAGLHFAFPNRMTSLWSEVPFVTASYRRTGERPNVKAYLKSDRHLPFNNEGIFRHYPELDAA